jgi:colicin import membrane protein
MSRRKKAVFIPFLIAVGLHVLIGILLVVGANFSLAKEKPKKETAVINATVISQQQFNDLADRKKAKRAAEQRKKDQIRKEKEKRKRDKARAKRREIEKKKRKEAEVKKQKRLKKENALRKKKEADRVKAEKLLAAKVAKKKKADALAKKRAEAKRQKKAEQERLRLKKIAQEKARADAKRQKEKKAKEAKARKERQERERKAKLEKERQAKLEKERLRQAELDRLMAAEFEDSFSSAQSSRQLSEIARYKALIQAKISRNWQVEPNMKGKSCTLAIRLASDGLVLSVKRSRGDTKLCNSARRATLKSKTLPIPKDPEISSKFRDFDITLEPEL